MDWMAPVQEIIISSREIRGTEESLAPRLCQQSHSSGLMVVKDWILSHGKVNAQRMRGCTSTLTPFVHQFGAYT